MCAHIHTHTPTYTRYSDHMFPVLLTPQDNEAENMVVYDVTPLSQWQDFGIFRKSNDLRAGESDKHT